MFKSAKIKLTASYVAIVMFVSVAFSSFVYVGVMQSTQRALESQKKRLERRLEVGPAPQRPGGFGPMIDSETFNEIRERTLLMLLVINSVVFVITGGAGYFIAGATLKPIEEATKKQKRFISDAAHEIKTPLTAMKANLEVTLRDKKLTLETAKECLQGVISDANMLQSLAESLLAQSRIQNGDSEKFVKTDLQQVVQGAIKLHAADAKNKNIEVSYEGVQLFINAQVENIGMAISNLIDNSVKYNKPGGNIDLKIEKTGQHAVLVIKDTGVGISDEDAPHIFEPFYRADKSRSKNNAKGYGLGLAIVKEILQKNKGSVQVKSKLGEGTEFILKFPLSGYSQ